ncbi:transcription factor E2F7 isoform X2 [Brienomyrus brachyistius]|uniref:transcription factor E2F7 isoform X2 n=1 Tax=Brienomyrus brachyistius TaxID=42636 RepID=UPI0020B328CD|nr:transcription factor E2F7 isoform X2 [Brienomyrus brachyistius]
MAGKSVKMESECVALKDLTCPCLSRSATDGDEVKNGHKENVFHPPVERRKVPPKSDGAASAPTGRRALSSEQLHATPTKQADQGAAEPWSPTANLKVLIQAASPDMHDREMRNKTEMRKVLFRPIENKNEGVALDYPSQFEVPSESADDIEKRPCRKRKSLGLLCQKFLALYPDYPASSEATSIPLDEVAVSLGAERRRLYDIVNVLESLKLVSRVAKNQYLWHGRQRLRETLSELRGSGWRQCCPLQEEDCQRMQTGEATVQDGYAETGFGVAGGRKDKSLRFLSQKFVTLFLVSEMQTVTLDLAARVLIDESQDTESRSKYKTKVRRLYDIANVLTSLGLIEKVQVKEERGKKPAFRWTGPVEVACGGDLPAAAIHSACHVDSHLGVSGGGKQIVGHPHFTERPAPFATEQRASSTPCSPPCGRTSPIPQPVDYSRKAASRRQQEDSQRIQNCDEPRVDTMKDRSECHAPIPSPIGVLEGPCRPLPLTSFYPPIGQACPQVMSTCPTLPSIKKHPLSHQPQASVFLLYGGKGAHWSESEERLSLCEPKERILGKRRTVEEEGPVAKRVQLSSHEEEPSLKVEMWSNVDRCHPRVSPRQGYQVPEEHSLLPPKGDEANTHSVPAPYPSSHYLYVPILPGTHSLSFLLSSGPVPVADGGLTALALPCVLLPSCALASHPPAGGCSCSCDAPAGLAPCGFVGSRPIAVSGPPASICGLEQPLMQVSTPPRSPVGLQAAPPALTMDVETLPTLRGPSSDDRQAFFQTPGTLRTGSPPAACRRGSAQRRLDIEHRAAN